MLIYTFDKTLDGLLTAVFDAFSLHQQPDKLLCQGAQLPLFCDEIHNVTTVDERAQRVWKGLETRLSPEALRLITVSSLSELNELYDPLFQYLCKVFRRPKGAPSIERNFSDPDVLAVTNIGKKVMHERLRMMQFVRFQKAKDGTYIGIVSPDHNVLPLVIDHFSDRFRTQPWMLYDAKRQYGFYYDQHEVTRITFEDSQQLPFSSEDGKLNDSIISSDEKLYQELWRTYFKAICIKERMNPRKQLSDMPRRYWKYMTEKNS